MRPSAAEARRDSKASASGLRFAHITKWPVGPAARQWVQVLKHQDQGPRYLEAVLGEQYQQLTRRPTLIKIALEVWHSRLSSYTALSHSSGEASIAQWVAMLRIVRTAPSSVA